jgi:PleD family two-component response regulator
VVSKPAHYFFQHNVNLYENLCPKKNKSRSENKNIKRWFLADSVSADSHLPYFSIQSAKENVMETNHVNILLVDSHPAEGWKIKTVLKQSMKPTFRIWLAHSREDALRTLEKDNVNIDIVVLDLFLVDPANPKETYKIIGQAAKDTPIIVIIGKQAYSLAREVTVEGAADVIVRERFDAHPQRLLDAIEFSMLRNRRLLQLKEKTVGEHKRVLHWMTGGYSHEIGEALDACL